MTNLYETEPDNFPRLMELFQDVRPDGDGCACTVSREQRLLHVFCSAQLQQTGPPPQELIKELAPGLEIGADGMPMLPHMGEGMPSLPGEATILPPCELAAPAFVFICHCIPAGVPGACTIM